MAFQAVLTGNSERTDKDFGGLGMKLHIDRENLFKDKMLNGINLFTGAGFSCLPDDEGHKLPVAEELCYEICEKFNLSYDDFGNDLETISALVDGSEFQDYLRDKFKVTKINNKYLLLNRLNLLSFITTNIDNIVHLAIEMRNRYYLKSIAYYGATRAEQAALCYIPLHGEVTNKEKPLLFKKFDLATADQANGDLFQQAIQMMRDKPIFFWGYGFHDAGVLKIIKKLLEDSSNDIWVQCRESDKKQIAVFRSLNCNIITGETDQIFEWIDENIRVQEVEKKVCEDISERENLKPYFLPTINQVPAVQSKDYFVKGITQWYSILLKQAIELDIVNDVYNECLVQKNTIIIGTDFSGKTTALMQLALKISNPNKLFINNLSVEKSMFIINNVKNMDVIIFIDNCEMDMRAYKILASAKNIRTVATATDYTFEVSKHLLENVDFKLMFIKDFTQEQARRFYYAIDKGLREAKFSYKDEDHEDEKFSILEMMLKNIRGSLKQNRVEKLLLRVLNTNKCAFAAVALSVYLSGNRSALSTDILISFFGCKSYEETRSYVNDANGLLRELSVSVDCCDDDQDYYDIRSKLFLRHAKKALIKTPKLKMAYSAVIYEFLKKVSPYKIYQYNLFRCSAYDAKFYHILFGKRASEIYAALYKYDHNPYTLQQWALYNAYQKNFKEAFALIDKAQHQKPNNFSMKNTGAIILFEANREDTSEIGRTKRMEAIAILEECYSNDKRKTYHANKFAEFVIEVANTDRNYDYVNKAIKWLSEIIERGEGSYFGQRCLKQLRIVRENMRSCIC